MPYHLYFFTPDQQQHYRADLLDNKDRARLAKAPQLAERLNWRTSRAGKQHIRMQHPTLQYCLSHKNDHSLIALAPEKPGVDLETLKPRDYCALIAQTGSPEEQRLLQQSPDPQRTFYQLWTLKEALIKAENLRFPTDMPRVGLTAQHQLKSLKNRHYLYLTLQLNDHFIASAVFPCLENHENTTIKLHSSSPINPKLIESNCPQLQITPLCLSD